ncbi:hypothetical protein C8A03DRAFT_36660 [Achaetomium macrosporum]|uniref:NADH dehydrogenase [ubiquinone] 1 alpha subcomplex assembly factor 3 n=1 Tax=Achaetomium macrosporum TaxID=79813 RepID=A0AAN7C4Y4_9PEZI|nr:hypothetical protein C8A03DRAFT_36660 [Achaetomium macrosporum]
MATPSPALRVSLISCRILRSHTTKCFSQRQPPHSRVQPTPLRLSSPTYYNRRDVLPSSHRAMHTSPPTDRQRKPVAHNREEVPDQPPPTDFGQLDVLASAPVPSTAVQVCHEDGFSLNSGIHITGGNGALLVGGEAFVWRPWSTSKKGKLVNEKGQWKVGEEGFALLGVVWPRPDLLILGLGPEIRPLSPATRRAISNLGMRVEVLDTRNAASQYNMLATERGVDDVAAALIPIGWKERAE